VVLEELVVVELELVEVDGVVDDVEVTVLDMAVCLLFYYRRTGSRS
jgi:hypothetical protein